MHVYLKASTDPPFDHLEIYPDVEDRSPSTEIDSLLRKPTRRREVEKSLLRKLDLRVAFLVLVYMTNYVSDVSYLLTLRTLIKVPRW